MNRYIMMAVLAAICWTGVDAQQSLPSRSLTIEGNYNPTVTDAGKIMPVPEKAHNDRVPVKVSYLTQPILYDKLKRSPMAAFGFESDVVEPITWSGLVRLGYGLRNLNEGLFDFRWNPTEVDQIRLNGSMDGWNSMPDGKWRSRMFNSRVAAGYEHQFRFFKLGLDTDFGFSRYNFMPGSLMDSVKLAASNLTLNTKQGSLSGYIRSVKINDASFYLTGGGEWMIRDGLNLNGTVRGNKEGIVRLGAGIEKLLDNGYWGLDYRQKTKVYRWYGINGCSYQGYTELTLTPSWHYSKGRIDANLGFNVDLRTGAGEPFLASPLAGISYEINNTISLQASVTGGVQEYDMRNLAAVSPYWTEADCIRDGYNLIDVWTGISATPLGWLSMSAKVGFRHTIDELFQVRMDTIIMASLLRQQTADVLYARMDADMQFSDRVLLRMDVTYSNYLGMLIGHNMELKPAFDGNLFGKFCVMRGLDLLLSYRLMAFHSVNGVAMPTVNDLGLTADYDITDKFSIYATFNHLMGGDFYYYAGYRALKPGFMLGASYRF